MTKRIVWTWVLLIIGLVGTGCSPSNSGPGKLEVRVGDHREAIGDFDELWLSFSAVGIHPAGQPRTEGWLELTASVQELDLTQYTEGRTLLITEAMVESGAYNAVRLPIDRATGILIDGRPVEVTVMSETAALDFQVRDGLTTVLALDLVVLDVSDHPGQDYELHLREATINARE